MAPAPLVEQPPAADSTVTPKGTRMPFLGSNKEEEKLSILTILSKSTPVDRDRDHPDFLAFRERNLQWRAGSAYGAHGEVSDLTPTRARGPMTLDSDCEMQRCSSWPCLPIMREERKVWMLSEGLEADLKAVYPNCLKRLQSRAVQVIVLVLVVCTYAACPLTVSMAQVVGMDGSVPIKGRPFKEGSVIVASWALIATVGLVLSAVAGGKTAVRQCFDRHAIVAFAPAGIGWALADVCEVLAVARLDPATYGVISQARLLGSAAAVWLIRGLNQNRLQWGVLATLSLVCMAYCLVPDDDHANKTRLLKWRMAHTEIKVNWLKHVPKEAVSAADGSADGDYIVGWIFALGKVALSVLSGVYGESVFKVRQQELHVQMTQVSFSSAVSALVGYYAICIVNEEDPVEFFSGPDGSWGWSTVLVAVVYCWREWICNLCVKRFDSLVKNICNAVALVVTYSFTVLNGEKHFSLLKALLLLAVVMEVVNYSTTRRQEQQAAASAEMSEAGDQQSPQPELREVPRAHSLTLDFHVGEYSALRRGSKPASRRSSNSELQPLSPRGSSRQGSRGSSQHLPEVKDLKVL